MSPSSFLALALLVVGVAAAPTPQETTYVSTLTAIKTVTALTTTTLTVTATATTSTPSSTGVLPSALASSGITGFLGTNTGIASWFRTNNTGDSTNGHSWCGFPYDDAVPGFAPSVDTMLANFGKDWQTAGTAYCGLEAIFTTPSGLNATLYLVDGFADPWVLTPGSVDVVTGAYPLLRGYQTSNKNDVVQGVTWSFTGNRKEQYKFNGVGSG